MEIPGRGQDKINHAHAFGGVDLAVETVEELFDVPVDYYVKLNFEAFVEIIDALGGVTVDVPLLTVNKTAPIKRMRSLSMKVFKR